MLPSSLDFWKRYFLRVSLLGLGLGVGGLRRRELGAGGLPVLGLRLVEGLVDEAQPLARRLVVLGDQHVSGVQRDDLLKPLRKSKELLIKDILWS